MKSLIDFTSLMLIAFTLSSCNLTSAAGIGSQGQPIKTVGDKITSAMAHSVVNVDHSPWDKLLKKHVNDAGFVNYRGFKTEQDKLEAYLTYLSKIIPNEEWSVQELLAYYINLYNAATVELILQNHPIKSIKDINGAFTKNFIKIGDKKLSLNAIENGVLRKMNEPRIHFAINCASYSCPKLKNEAYTAAKINEQLDAATREFINSDLNEITPNNPKFSRIFSFYTSDFKVDGKKDLIGFINKYSNIKMNPKTRYTFKKYNWSLNEQ